MTSKLNSKKSGKPTELTEEEVSEGLTINMVDGIDMVNRCVPVQMKRGDPIKSTLPCTGGFWLMEGGKALKGPDNKYIVFSQKECQIGRARYILNFGKAEKEKKAQELVLYWKGEIQKKIDGLGELVKPSSLTPIVRDALIQNLTEEKGPEFADDYIVKMDAKEKANKEAYDVVLQMWNDGKFIDLLALFGIKEFPQTMMTASLDNEKEMESLKNVFGAEQMAKFDGDMLYKYAQIEIEKQY